jgi:hypothetical protein
VDEGKGSWWTHLIAAAVGGVIVGLFGYLTMQQQFYRQQEEHRQDNQQRCYSRLLGIKEAMLYENFSYLGHQALSTYYQRRYRVLTKDEDDHNAALRSYNEAFVALENIARLRREMMETVGEIKVLFVLDASTTAALDTLERLGKFNFDNDAPVKPKSFAELNLWFESKNNSINDAVEKTISTLFDPVLAALLAQLHSKPSATSSTVN